MTEFFRNWKDIHFAILYALIFAVQVGLYIFAQKKKQDRYWVALLLLQFASIPFVIFGKYGGEFLSFPNNLYSSIVALPVYGLFFLMSLSVRASTDDMPRQKLWKSIKIGVYLLLAIAVFGTWITDIVKTLSH